MSNYSREKMKESQELISQIEALGAKSVGSILVFQTADGKLILAQGYGSALDTYGGLIPELCRRINAPHLTPAAPDKEEHRG